MLVNTRQKIKRNYLDCETWCIRDSESISYLPLTNDKIAAVISQCIFPDLIFYELDCFQTKNGTLEVKPINKSHTKKIAYNYLWKALRINCSLRQKTKSNWFDWDERKERFRSADPICFCRLDGYNFSDNCNRLCRHYPIQTSVHISLWSKPLSVSTLGERGSPCNNMNH